MSHTEAVPLLVSWLERLQDLDLVGRQNTALYEGIVRALSVKEARALAAGPLVREFWRVQNDHIRWTIGNALSVLADRSLVDQLLEIVREPRFGVSRQMVVDALGRAGRGRPDVVETLIELLVDEDLKLHAVGALGRLGATASRPHVENLLRDERAVVRKAAATALRKFDRLDSDVR